jgi:hypothetical protein
VSVNWTKKEFASKLKRIDVPAKDVRVGDIVFFDGDPWGIARVEKKRGDESGTMKQHSEKDLARAKRVREKHIARMTVLYGACTCMYPLCKLRNSHGHEDGCPAIVLWQKFRDEDADARAELDL